MLSSARVSPVAFARRHPVAVGAVLGFALAAIFSGVIVGLEWGVARSALESAQPEWWEKEQAGALRLVAAILFAGTVAGWLLGWRAGRIMRWRRLKLTLLALAAYFLVAIAGAFEMMPTGEYGTVDAIFMVVLSGAIGAVAYGIFFGPLVIGGALLLERVTRPALGAQA
jgi:hypothetical protein